MGILEDNFVSLLDLDTLQERNDLRLPEGQLGTDIKDAFDKEETGILVSPLNLDCFRTFISGSV